jgi:hypothetical protein
MTAPDPTRLLNEAVTALNSIPTDAQAPIAVWDAVRGATDKLNAALAMPTLHLRPRPSDWHACINGNETLWGCGKTVEEAVAATLRNHRRDLLTPGSAPVSVLLTLPPTLTR